LNRYQRQMLLPQIGPAGQARLAGARVLVVGCGALGSVLADQLARAGIGWMRLVDRDVVEWTNLQRQVLYDEADARRGEPKAVAAAARLRAVNSEIEIEPVVADVHPGNMEDLAGLAAGDRPVDLILDGTDNVETRFLINDVAVKHGIPWVYGACVGTEGRVMPVRPPATACLRCVFPEPPGPGELPTCDTAGVLGPAAALVASLQAVAAIQLLFGGLEPGAECLTTIDVWTGRYRQTSIAQAKRPDCPACGHRQFEFLDRADPGRSVSLCGRNAIQVRPAGKGVAVNLGALAERLQTGSAVVRTPYLLRCWPADAEGIALTVFKDGRAIIHGVTDPDRAKSLYARWVGS
jgi:adenylyltransferase/sulfurtransferase